MAKHARPRPGGLLRPIAFAYLAPVGIVGLLMLFVLAFGALAIALALLSAVFKP